MILSTCQHYHLTIRTLGLFMLFCGLTNCALGPQKKVVEVQKTSGFQQNHGPFDSNGNYVDAWADNPPKRKYFSANRTPPKPTVAPIAPTPTFSPSKPKYTPRPTPVVKTVSIKPAKKAPRIHSVKRGDTLYGLALKYKTSVGSIQRANRMRNTVIGIGQKLIIPR